MPQELRIIQAALFRMENHLNIAFDALGRTEKDEYIKLVKEDLKVVRVACDSMSKGVSKK